MKKDKIPEKKSLMTDTIVDGAANTGVAMIAMADPLVGLLASGISPLLANKMKAILSNRASKFQEVLKDNKVELTELNFSKFSNDQIDLIREVFNSSLSTDEMAKVRSLVSILIYGLSSEIHLDVIAARRYARTIARMDEVEMLIMGVLEKCSSVGESLDEFTIRESLRINNDDLLTGGLLTLQGEGLLQKDSSLERKYSITDYGLRLTSLLREVFKND